MSFDAIAEGPRWASLGAAAIALLWGGLLVGVAFLATPAKFSAASLTLPVALDVGRVTFHLLIKVEGIALLLLLVFTALARLPIIQFVPLILLLLCLMVQVLILLPPLDARVAAIIAGETPPPSGLHLYYVGVELITLATLLGSAFVTARLSGLLA